jgi:hypothetical protein
VSRENNVGRDFRLEEYKMLRTKAQDLTRRIEELERNVVIACSAIFVFAVVTFETDHKYERLILFFLPFCVSVLGFVRYKGLAFYMKDVNSYTARVEIELGGGGWLTHYYSEDRARTDDHYRQYREAIWYAIIFFNALAGGVLTYSLFRG